MNSNAFAYLAGHYLGSMILTGLLTRGAVAFFRKRAHHTSPALLSFLSVAALVLIFRTVAAIVQQSANAGSLGRAVTGGPIIFGVIDLPCLVVWLGFDLYRGRSRGRPAS